MLARQTRSGEGREGVACVLLGRGASAAKVEQWLEAAAPIDGFIGFAIGRSIWWDALKAFLSARTRARRGRLSRSPRTTCTSFTCTRGRRFTDSHARRSAHRRRGLSRTERRDPCCRAQGDRWLRRSGDRLSRRLAWSSGGLVRGAHDRVNARDPAARRDDPQELAHEPVQAGGRSAEGARDARAPRGRCSDRDRGRGHPRRRQPTVWRGSARRRRAEDDRQRPRGDRRDVRLRHRAAASRPRRSTVSTPPPRATTGSWSSR